MNITREDAWALLNEHTKSESLLKHALTVEAAMKHYAEIKNQDSLKWSITGLIHDFDYEKYPTEENHPFKGVEILKEKNYPDDIIEAVLGHADYSGVERKTDMAKTLFAVDELCGMIMAVAYVRPDKLNGMKPKSVKKKMKDKQFAAKVNRNDIEKGITDLGIDKDEHIKNVIEALQKIAPQLGF
jgi:putative nucleotidyltransferase with HDIG domain